MDIVRKTGLRAALLVALLWAVPAFALPGSVEWFVNGMRDYDYGRQITLPAGFGDGEFTLEVWLRPNDAFQVGPVSGGGTAQRENWASEDPAPYSSSTWWYRGNFLLDGHNNSAFSQGTFSMQFYGGGRVRWLFGDGANPGSGGLWAVQAYPANSAPSLLDGSWHQVTLVRRWSGQSEALLELWVDGSLVATELSSVRANMRQWWDTWPGFGDEAGWFWGAEKGAALGKLGQYEDYKGLVDELRFWSRAKSSSEIASNFADPVTGNEPGLVGWHSFKEAQGTQACDDTAPSRCIELINANVNVWSPLEAPIGSSGDVTPPTMPGNLQGTALSASEVQLVWDASTDNIAVVDYVVRRDGDVVGTVTSTSFTDSGLSADTSYAYTVTARDAAGNVSPDAAVSVTTQPGSDAEAPSTPANLTGVAASGSQVNLSWDASVDNVGVVEYRISRDGVRIATVAETSYSDTGLVPGTSYLYTVVAADAAGNASGAASVTVTTASGSDVEAPSPPSNLAAAAVSASRVDLAWDASTDNVGVVDYLVLRDGLETGTTSEAQFSDTGLASNTLYVYSVIARDAAGNQSLPSATISVTTAAAPDPPPPPDDPPRPSASGGGGALGLAWLLLGFLVLPRLRSASRSQAA